MKEIIERVIRGLEKTTQRLRRAYINAYGDKFLAREFYDHISVLKEHNKQAFIAEMATRYAKKMMKDGLLISPEMAFMKGAEMFKMAKMSGDIDCMNRLKGLNENE